MTLSIGILGANGRMGQALQNAIDEHKDTVLGAAVTRGDADWASAAEDANVLIDVTLGSATPMVADALAEIGKPVVMCATGQDELGEAAIQTLGTKVPVLLARNTSLGAALLERFSSVAARLFPDDTEVHIQERHHAGKLDAPSGTARALKAALDPHLGPDRNIEITSTREGDYPGQHDVVFTARDEVLTLSHTASDRRLFAEGALAGARWVWRKQVGLYTMQDMLEDLLK